ncbi:MAG TPA: BMP family ABC transporter substrate-binding protein [Anaerolineales bacterium]|nr:BMP family ABC transporter substrate-binding protein [Anaerolineales bacterium]
MKRLHVLLAACLVVTSLGSACTPATIDCASEEILCVGLVTDVGKISDNSFNQSAWEGIQQAQKQFGGQAQYIETVDSRDYAKNIAAFGDLHYDVIVTVGYSLHDATIAAAQTTYPNIDFIGVDQFQNEPVHGVAGLNFHEDETGFLGGALAALMSKSHKIGAVCGTDAIPAVWRLGEGYKAGAAYADQQMSMTTEVYVLYHGNDDQAFTDPEWGANTAGAMIDQGADVIFSCGNATGDGALVAAAQAKLYVIGIDTDQYLTLPKAAPHMLSSVVKLVAPGVFELIKLSQEGAFPSGNYFGKAGYAPFHDLENEVPADVRAEMKKIEAGFLDGSIKTGVPDMKPPG